MRLGSFSLPISESQPERGITCVCVCVCVRTKVRGAAQRVFPPDPPPPELRVAQLVRPSDLSTVIATTAEESLLRDRDRSHPCSAERIASEDPSANANIDAVSQGLFQGDYSSTKKVLKLLM